MTDAEIAATSPPAGAAAAPHASLRLRQIYWSIRRELWEHPSIYIAPLTIAAVALVGFLFGLSRLPHTVLTLASPTTAAHAANLIALPYEFVAFATIVTGLLVAMVYCLGALQTERRDRSILFWKSLPVSDLTTVIAKVAVPLVIVPVVVFVVIAAAELVVLALSTLVVLASELDASVLWVHAPFPFVMRSLAGGLPAIALWYAPIFGWLLLVSAWARRVPYLWALGVPLMLALVEGLAFSTDFVWRWLVLRLTGIFAGAINSPAHRKWLIGQDTDPASWTGPHVWIGVALAGLFLAGAVWLRRAREPI